LKWESGSVSSYHCRGACCIGRPRLDSFRHGRRPRDDSYLAASFRILYGAGRRKRGNGEGVYQKASIPRKLLLLFADGNAPAHGGGDARTRAAGSPGVAGARSTGVDELRAAAAGADTSRNRRSSGAEKRGCARGTGNRKTGWRTRTQYSEFPLGRTAWRDPRRFEKRRLAPRVTGR
jgi:hypothetical protein